MEHSHKRELEIIQQNHSQQLSALNSEIANLKSDLDKWKCKYNDLAARVEPFQVRGSGRLLNIAKNYGQI